MEIKTREDYINDPRMPCKYGLRCYQKNPIHVSKFKHPPKKEPRETAESDQSTKKQKLDSIEENHSSSNSASENRLHILDTALTASCNDKQKGKLEGNASHTLDNAPSHNDKEKETEENSSKTTDYVPANIDESEFIKSKFLVEMPRDFYSFWEFCKNLKTTDPLMALNDVGLSLVGPFEVLAGKFNGTPLKKIDEYVLHWRYFYDPPEFQTVIKRNDNSGYHLGYFRDSPDQLPVFLAYNFAKTDGKFTVVGNNLFAAVSSFLNFLKKHGNPFMKTHVFRYNNLIQKEAEKLNFNLSTSKITTRKSKILTRTFNTLGIVVPYNKSTQLGYRPLSISNHELQTLLTKLENAGPPEKDKLMIEFQGVLTNTNIAIDECDFGTGLELGLDILCSGVESLNSVAARLLATSYRLLNRDPFAVIAESHMKKRQRGFNLSVLQ